MKLVLAFLVFSMNCAFAECVVKKEQGFSKFSLKFSDEIWTSLPRLSEDAEVRKCEELKDFPGLYLAEVSTGIQGTTSPRNEFDLVVIDTRKGKAEVVFKRLIEIHRGKDIEKFPFSFSKSKDGKKAVLKMKKITKTF